MMEAFLFAIKGGFPCVFQAVTGFYCPGCGGTRAVEYLLRAEVGRSIQYHPLVAYMAFVLMLEAGSWGLAKIFRRQELYIRRYDIFAYVGIVIILTNWIWKNYMLLVKGIDLLP